MGKAIVYKGSPIKQNFFKICIVGDSGVGKTTILHQYINKRFKSKAEITIGSNFFVKYLKLPEVKNLLTLQVWDLAGQDYFKWVRLAFYKSAKGIIYVFDLTRKNTLERLQNWKEEIEGQIGICPSLLVGNKIDLINPQMQIILKEEINKSCQILGTRAYFETSGKKGTNIDDVFYRIATEMYEK
ncbi:MAG: GTP-binding protein [Candidatus Lokiarchaeota archaeon]|nr:GTP-binding protein [Candidatus Lokiarchaeota archaeon]